MHVHEGFPAAPVEQPHSYGSLEIAAGVVMAGISVITLLAATRLEARTPDPGAEQFQKTIAELLEAEKIDEREAEAALKFDKAMYPENQ